MRCQGLAGVHRRRWRHGKTVGGDLAGPGATTTSPPIDRTGCGSPTSPNTAPAKGGSMPPWSSTCSPAGSWAGRSPITCAPNSSSTPSTWPAGDANRTATVVHSDRGTQYTSWLFGHRLREAGLLGSMGKVACAYDNSLMESFFGSMQIELLDRRIWTTRAELTNAIFEWIEAFYNPVRRHSALGLPQPHRPRTTSHRRQRGGMITTPTVSGKPWAGQLRLHDTRHTTATAMIFAGVDDQIVAQLLGHNSVMVTRTVYSHVLKERLSPGSRADDRASGRQSGRRQRPRVAEHRSRRPAAGQTSTSGRLSIEASINANTSSSGNCTDRAKSVGDTDHSTSRVRKARSRSTGVSVGPISRSPGSARRHPLVDMYFTALT